jgi:undecaprenyl-diphosphatase
VLGSLLGVSDRSSGYADTQVTQVRVVSRSGPQEVAYDGETGERATEFLFRKRARLPVYCCRTD